MENRFAGRSGEALLAEGIAQMQRVGQRLRREKIAAVYCGPAVRTMQSAEIIAELLQAPVFSRPAFDEISIPHWEGLTKDEIRQQYGGQYPAWLAAPQNFRLPGCETLTQVQERAAGALNRIVSESPGQNVLLVSHLIVLRCLALYFQGRGLRDFREVKIGNGTIIKVSGAGEGRVTLLLLQS